MKRCKFCGNEFSAGKRVHKVFCKKLCSMQYYKVKNRENYKPKGPYRRYHNCQICNKRYVAKAKISKYCSDKCRLEKYNQHLINNRIKNANKNEEGVINKINNILLEWTDLEGNKFYNLPTGYYVYGWYNDDLPFYIGEGCGKRAWIRHTANDNKLANCEYVRNEQTRVVIYRNNLTKEGSLLLESCLIKLFISLGAELTNDRSGITTNRQEKSPLCLEEIYPKS